jgi:hypothetical protein
MICLITYSRENKKMAKCELLERCPFFNEKMARMPRSAEIMKNMFCKGKYGECARYLVYKKYGSENVPKDLFPGEYKRARDLIKKGSSEISVGR